VACVEDDECAPSPCGSLYDCHDVPAPGAGHDCVYRFEVIRKLIPEATTYDTGLLQHSGTSLSSTIQSFGSQGYVITAATTNTAGYTVWGFRPAGSTQVYDTRLLQHSGTSLSSTIQSFGSQGYVITAATTNTAGYTVWGFRPSGTTQGFETRLSQNQGVSHSSTIHSLGSQ
jgi:hypothetical protein